MKTPLMIFATLSITLSASCEGLSTDEAEFAIVDNPWIVECGKSRTDRTPLRPLRTIVFTGDTLAQASAQCTQAIVNQCKAGLFGVQRSQYLECGKCKDGSQCGQKKYTSSPNGAPVADVQCEDYTYTDLNGKVITRWSCACGCKRPWHEFLDCEPCDNGNCAADEDGATCDVEPDIAAESF